MSGEFLVVGAFDAEKDAVESVFSQDGMDGQVDAAVWSDEICFIHNQRMPGRDTATRKACLEACAGVGTVTVIHELSVPAALLPAQGEVLVPAADADAGRLPAGAAVRTFDAQKGVALSEAGSDVARTPAQAEFDSWLYELFVKPALIELYNRFIVLFLSRLENAGIAYFAHSGTSLGMVRNHGFIPWDDDFDIMVMEDQEEAVKALIPELERYGIFHNTKNDNRHFYQFYIKRADLPATAHFYLPIDIFIGHTETLPGVGEVVHYKSPTFRKWFAKNYIDPEDMYPLRPYSFGPIQVMGLRDHDRYHHRSGYSHTEAVVMRHQNFEKFKERLPFFKEQGLHPITDMRYVGFRMPHGPAPEVLGPVSED